MRRHNSSEIILHHVCKRQSIRESSGSAKKDFVTFTIDPFNAKKVFVVYYHNGENGSFAGNNKMTKNEDHYSMEGTRRILNLGETNHFPYGQEVPFTLDVAFEALSNMIISQICTEQDFDMLFRSDWLQHLENRASDSRSNNSTFIHNSLNSVLCQSMLSNIVANDAQTISIRSICMCKCETDTDDCKEEEVFSTNNYQNSAGLESDIEEQTLSSMLKQWAKSNYADLSSLHNTQRRRRRRVISDTANNQPILLLDVPLPFELLNKNEKMSVFENISGYGMIQSVVNVTDTFPSQIQNKDKVEKNVGQSWYRATSPFLPIVPPLHLLNKKDHSSIQKSFMTIRRPTIWLEGSGLHQTVHNCMMVSIDISSTEALFTSTDTKEKTKTDNHTIIVSGWTDLVQVLSNDVFMDTDMPSPSMPNFGCSVGVTGNMTSEHHDDDGEALNRMFSEHHCNVTIFPPIHRVIDIEQPSFAIPSNLLLYHVSFELTIDNDDPSYHEPPKSKVEWLRFINFTITFESSIHFRYPIPRSHQYMTTTSKEHGSSSSRYNDVVVLAPFLIDSEAELRRAGEQHKYSSGITIPFVSVEDEIRKDSPDSTQQCFLHTNDTFKHSSCSAVLSNGYATTPSTAIVAQVPRGADSDMIWVMSITLLITLSGTWIMFKQILEASKDFCSNCNDNLKD